MPSRSIRHATIHRRELNPDPAKNDFFCWRHLSVAKIDRRSHLQEVGVLTSSARPHQDGPTSSLGPEEGRAGGGEGDGGRGAEVVAAAAGSDGGGDGGG